MVTVRTITDRIATAIRQTREHQGLGQKQLSQMLGKSDDTVSKYETRGVVHLTRITELEDTMQVPHGTILRAAGYLSDESQTVREAIASDPQLSEAEAEMVLGVYDAAIRLSASDATD